MLQQLLGAHKPSMYPALHPNLPPMPRCAFLMAWKPSDSATQSFRPVTAVGSRSANSHDLTSTSALNL